MTDSLNGESVGEHPSSEEVAAYLSDGLSTSERAQLEAHLVVCQQCRGEVMSARRLLRTQAPRRVLRWIPPAAAAAVLAIVLLSPLRSARLGTGAKRAKEDPAVSVTAPRIRIVSPASGDTVRGSGIVFSWERAANAPLYRLTLTDASGATVWTGDTADTTVTLPRTVSLETRHSYFWFVDALGADGTTVTTGTNRFLVGN